MKTDVSIIEGAYIRDLLEQPDALRRTLTISLPDSLLSLVRQMDAPHPPFIVLTGMGSSFHALYPIASQLADHGIHTTMIETSELIYYWRGVLGPNTILIVVSQSGRSAEILRLLDLNGGRSQILAVTNDLSSPLAREANSLVPIDAGIESTVSCKTYVSTLLALSRVADVFCSLDAESISSHAEALADGVESYLADWRSHVGAAQDCLQRSRNIILAGRGASQASAGTGGLIIKEAARFPAEGMSSAAFRHGPLEMVDDTLFLLVFEGAERSAELNRRLVSDVAGLGAGCALVSDKSPLALFKTPSTIEPLLPIAEILPVQMITLALAAGKGLEAGAFSRASKITSIE